MSPGHIKQALNRLATAAYRKLKNVSTNMRYSGYREKYDIHETFTFNGEGVLLYGPGEIVIGEHSYIGRFSQIQAQDGTSVIIGKKCRISHFVAVYTANTEADEDLLASTTSRVCKGSVRIGDGCWIGYGVFICEGVTIGEGTERIPW